MLEYAVIMAVEEAFKKVMPPGIDIIREYPLRGGRRADFVLVSGFEILACIEVKSNLSNRRLLADAQKQVGVYQKDTHSYWGIVTDGNRYYIQSIVDDKFEEKESAEAVFQVILGIEKGKEENTSKSKDASEIESLKYQFLDICDCYIDKIPTIEQVKNVLAGISSTICEVTPTKYIFKRSFENRFFQALLGTYTEEGIVRYIPFASAYRSLNEQTIGMVSLIGMNDISECYYADQYISRKKGEESSASILPAERKLLNNTYILSCNDQSKEDDLTMWRLYGDNCKGVCIKMCIEKDILAKNDTFILAPVSYGRRDEHPELDLANDILSINIGGKNLIFETWCYWKHFFKDYRYSVEKEVRLLYTGRGEGKRSWILVRDNEIPCTISIFPVKSLPNHSNDFPLTLSGVIIGSKCIDIETKKSQFEELVSERNTGYNNGFAEVKESIIDNYR